MNNNKKNNNESIVQEHKAKVIVNEGSRDETKCVNLFSSGRDQTIKQLIPEIQLHWDWEET